MRFLRQNTAIRLTVGPFFDKTDGVTPETALTATNEHLTLMVDDGNVPTLVLDANATASSGNNDMVHVTNDDAGFYDLELTAAQTNYVGRAMLAITYATDHCPVFHEFMILPANVYDSFVLGTDLFQTDVTQLLGTAWLTPGTAGTPDVNVKLISADATAADNAEAFFDGTGYAGTNNVIPTVTTSGLSAGAVDAIMDEVITSGHTTAGSLGKVVADNLNAPVGTVDTVVDGIKAKTDNLPASPAAVGSAMTLADDAITSAKYDESTAFPLKSADTGSTTVARTGADSDTLETISDQLDTVTGYVDGIPGDILDHAIADHLTAGTVGNLIASLGGKMTVTGNQLVILSSDNTTELFRFNLTDSGGNPTMTDVYTRTRV